MAIVLSRPVVTIATAAVTAAGCNGILGFEGGELHAPPTTASAGSGGAGGSGGAAIGGAVQQGGGGGGGNGGRGGAGPVDCELLVPGMCPPSEKCTVLNESTGETGCVQAGFHPPWASCQSDADCHDGTWCDHGTLVCKPVCYDAENCFSGGGCLHALAAGGGNIPGLQICAANCNPLDSQACNPAYGSTSCLDTIHGFDCFAAGTQGAHESCDELTDCAAGLRCRTISFLRRCRPWCLVAADDCPWPRTCQAFTNPLYYDGEELGVCA